MSAACRPNFAQVSRTTLKFQQAWLKTSSLVFSVAILTRGISVSERDVNHYQKWMFIACKAVTTSLLTGNGNMSVKYYCNKQLRGLQVSDSCTTSVDVWPWKSSINSLLVASNFPTPQLDTNTTVRCVSVVLDTRISCHRIHTYLFHGVESFLRS